MFGKPGLPVGVRYGVSENFGVLIQSRGQFCPPISPLATSTDATFFFFCSQLLSTVSIALDLPDLLLFLSFLIVLLFSWPPVLKFAVSALLPRGLRLRPWPDQRLSIPGRSLVVEWGFAGGGLRIYSEDHRVRFSFPFCRDASEEKRSR